MKTRQKTIKNVDRAVFRRTANSTAKANIMSFGRGGVRL